MDDLLKKIAKLDGHNLEIYDKPPAKVCKPEKPPKQPRVYNRKPKQVYLTPSDWESFNFDTFASKFSTICEADVAFAKLDQHSTATTIKRIIREDQKGISFVL